MAATPKHMGVYLAGPIFGCTDEECKDWRAYCKDRLAVLGTDIGVEFEALDPMVRDYRGREDDCILEIVEGDKQDIDRAAFLIINYSGPSVGTVMETYYAWAKGKCNILVSSPETPLSPWLRYHTHILCNSFEEAIADLGVLARHAP